ncbi:MAG: hypothetical protein PHV32_02670 [Eubacteriales bacterium]|nr:hypothetical protein [Eubacteriales bacterium]
MKRKETRSIRLYVYLIYLLVVTFVVTGVSFSRYSKIVPASDEATVAVTVIEYVPISASYNGSPITDIEEGLSLTDMEPGDEIVYNFEIRNFDATKQNQVLMKYMISVLFDPSPSLLPLDYTLTPGGSYPSPGSGWITMGFDGEITHSYTLTITWDEGETGQEYSDKEQNVRIDIDFVQMDN